MARVLRAQLGSDCRGELVHVTGDRRGDFLFGQRVGLRVCVAVHQGGGRGGLGKVRDAGEDGRGAPAADLAAAGELLEIGVLDEGSGERGRGNRQRRERLGEGAHDGETAQDLLLSAAAGPLCSDFCQPGRGG